MAEFKVKIIKDNVREKQNSQNTVEITDELFSKLSSSNQTLVNLHEKFIGEVTHLVKYTNGYGVPADIIAAIDVKFGLV